METTKECVNENLIDFKSPSINSDNSYKNDNSPGSNPFDTLSCIASDNPFLFSGNLDFDCGRESLGILQIDLGKIKFDDTNWLTVPEICVDNENTLQVSAENSPNAFNKAFLYSHQNMKVSTSSSIPSSISSLPESLKFWDLSKIPSATSLVNTINMESLSALNNGFINSSNKSNLFLETENEHKSNINLKRWPTRIQSLPDVLEDQNVDNAKVSEPRLMNPYLKNFRKSESLFKRSFTLPQIAIDVEVEDNEFNDSVFIEAKHIASKIADESILNLADAELYSIDCTSPPELIETSDVTDEENVVSTEMIFKTVDKMIPSTSAATATDKLQEETNSKNKSAIDIPNKTMESSSSSCSSLNRRDCMQNLSEIFSGDKKLSKSRLSHCSSNKSKSHDANSILHNLSEILNNDHPSHQQKSEGQNLLFSLADILCSSDRRDSLNEQEQSEDSGHSSIDQDVVPMNAQDINCSPLDLRINSETPAGEPKPLDLSISKKMQQDEIVDLSISKSRGMTDNSRIKSKNESANSNDSKNLSNMKGNITNLASFGKLKPKRIEGKVIPEKGPLKAMIPIVNMAKSRGVTKTGRFSTTPTKSLMTGCKIKRTSTPKSDSKPQPVAQSTPDGNLNTRKSIPTPTQLRQRRFDAPVSPLTRTNSVTNTSTAEASIKNRSDSAPNLSSSCNSKNTSSLNNSSKIMFRRRSASDIKIGPDGNKFKRSNTIDKDSGIAKTLNRVRENIEKARNSSSNNGKLLGNIKPVQTKSILGEGNRILSSSNIKPCNLVNKIRRSNGKENNCE